MDQLVNRGEDSVEPLPLVRGKLGHSLEHVRHNLRVHLQLIPPALLGHDLLPVLHYELEREGSHGGGPVQIRQNKHVWK